MIPLIDLFAGPGGLCEGFSHEMEGKHHFLPILSIEKDEIAHLTLQLRSFVHYFAFHALPLPSQYYRYVNGEISRENLFASYPEAAQYAKSVAWHATLGGGEVSERQFDRRIKQTLAGNSNWVLIGGPPCQAYSLAGRSRSIGRIKKRDNVSFDQAQLVFSSDERQTLYKQYLRILAVHRPAIFVMENVAGMLSAKVNGERIFPKILSDLAYPVRSAREDWPGLKGSDKRAYRIFSFVTGREFDGHNDVDFLIRAERYGVPQARHRVILLGIRHDYARKLDVIPTLQPLEQATVQMAIGDLPKLRSHISHGAEDSDLIWSQMLHDFGNNELFASKECQSLRTVLLSAETVRNRWLEGTPCPPLASRKAEKPMYLKKWYWDSQLRECLNHAPRSHMTEDLKRYLFVAAYGQVHGKSPVLSAFPQVLLPAHNNVLRNGEAGEQSFADRFKVQLPNRASSTVTCHIAKDGHYFIHYDVSQCRSLTVREAARLQTFPDNYFFEGNQTEQYHQVGNAVPPLLASQLAKIVFELFERHADCVSRKKQRRKNEK